MQLIKKIICYQIPMQTLISDTFCVLAKMASKTVLRSIDLVSGYACLWRVL